MEFKTIKQLEKEIEELKKTKHSLELGKSYDKHEKIRIKLIKDLDIRIKRKLSKLRTLKDVLKLIRRKMNKIKKEYKYYHINLVYLKLAELLANSIEQKIQG